MPQLLSDAEKRAIALHARQLGFELFGVASPDRPPSYDRFSRWIAEGKHGEMSYLASAQSMQRRMDPRLILPECRSILVLGTPYSSPNARPNLNDTGRFSAGGRVAAYAWGRDYHDVLPERMRELVAFIEKLVGADFPHREYTDTGPLLERDLAQRAGLGWIGKNSCLINPEQGSYFFLSEILLGLDIELDLPFWYDRCGKCTRCQDACPTHCIQPDRTIDARRCLSYLTIELKGSIPRELRSRVGQWVFGCDICQQVCPWNADKVQRKEDPAFKPGQQIPAPELTSELLMTQQAFSLKFSHSPLKRAKRAGYLRNVAVCLGNTYYPEAVAALAAALLDHEPLVRAHAAWALGEIGGNKARLSLIAAAAQEADPNIQDEIRSALARLSG